MMMPVAQFMADREPLSCRTPTPSRTLTIARPRRPTMRASQPSSLRYLMPAIPICQPMTSRSISSGVSTASDLRMRSAADSAHSLPGALAVQCVQLGKIVAAEAVRPPTAPSRPGRHRQSLASSRTPASRPPSPRSASNGWRVNRPGPRPSGSADRTLENGGGMRGVFPGSMPSSCSSASRSASDSSDASGHGALDIPDLFPGLLLILEVHGFLLAAWTASMRR